MFSLGYRELMSSFMVYLKKTRFDENTKKHYINELERTIGSIERGNPLGEKMMEKFFLRFPDFDLSDKAYKRGSFANVDVDRVKIDLVVICALKEPEAEEIIKLIKNKTEGCLKNNILYTKGFFCFDDGFSISVAVFFQNQMGPVEAGVMTTMVLAEFRPEYLAMVGVCGGFADKGIKIGDVLVVSKSITYQSGEYADGQFVPEPRIALSSDMIIRYVRQYDKKIQRQITDNASTDSLSNVKIKIGTMLCGDAVINEPGMMKSFSEKLDRRVVGVDMESYGVLRACEIYGSQALKTIIAKGVMDVCEGRVEKRDKIAAAYSSASFLYCLFAELFNKKQK